jgi:hypothetical protein
MFFGFSPKKFASFKTKQQQLQTTTFDFAFFQSGKKKTSWKTKKHEAALSLIKFLQKTWLIFQNDDHGML